MDKRIETLRSFIRGGGHFRFRNTPKSFGLDRLAGQFQIDGIPPVERSARMLKALLNAEAPIIIDGERIVATRTISRIPSIFTEEEWAGIRSKHTLHERGTVSNISADYEGILKDGLERRRQEVLARMEDPALTQEQKQFLTAARESIEAVQDFILKYRDCARNAGMNDLADVLSNISKRGASSLWEALQLLRMVHFALWESDCYHNTLGRFDQYIYPYYEADLKAGRITEQQGFDLIEEFFLACNKDSDLYVGMQQGDNGQSIVLGGRDQEGNYRFNKVSEICLKASYELNLIDPKINLRCDAGTPLEIYELGAKLTERGLGFPQYDNDDVVIPGLLKLGYAPEDAYNYVVAACWEFIIPKNGMEIVNIDALSFAGIVSAAVEHLGEYSVADVDSFLQLHEIFPG